ncbi:hypothetical protein [Shewanella sp. Isolate7]|uniref:hypothetical protein n=1 Tax=Shewanella sp. Isolate7 TaxID=2908528 RepID=UPI001EFCB0F1|nr:hypothetical protein [Shewanella sp. Isolate7]MCG9720890.1 hypothetical protein [Shewanella sp. Isolate7]
MTLFNEKNRSWTQHPSTRARRLSRHQQPPQHSLNQALSQNLSQTLSYIAKQTFSPLCRRRAHQTAPALKHSGLGIAAFILSILSTLLIFALVTIAGVLEATTPGGIDETSPEAIIVGMLIFAFIGLALVGLGLGIGGLNQKQRKKIFAILGTIFSSVTIMATLALITYGTTID